MCNRFHCCKARKGIDFILINSVDFTRNRKEQTLKINGRKLYKSLIFLDEIPF